MRDKGDGKLSLFHYVFIAYGNISESLVKWYRRKYVELSTLTVTEVNSTVVDMNSSNISLLIKELIIKNIGDYITEMEMDLCTPLYQ